MLPRARITKHIYRTNRQLRRRSCSRTNNNYRLLTLPFSDRSHTSNYSLAMRSMTQRTSLGRKFGTPNFCGERIRPFWAEKQSSIRHPKSIRHTEQAVFGVLRNPTGINTFATKSSSPNGVPVRTQALSVPCHPKHGLPATSPARSTAESPTQHAAGNLPDRTPNH